MVQGQCRIPAAVPEIKMVTRTLSSIFPSVGTAWVENDIGNIGQGVTVFTRIGRRATLLYCEISGVLCQGDIGTTLDDPYNTVRVVIGLYKSAVPVPLNTAGAVINSPITKELSTNGLLIYKYIDRYIPMSAKCLGATAGYVPSTVSLNFRFRIGQTVIYGADNANFADKVLVMSVISDSTVAPSPGFIAGYLRVGFRDS